MPFRLAFLLSIVFLFSIQSAMAQTQPHIKSTGDLAALLGEWEVSRTYRPNDSTPKILNGQLHCVVALDSQFVKCTYEMTRPGRSQGLDEVYFNYNRIYDSYESLWLSSTWPVKVLMNGDLIDKQDEISLITSAQFEIEQGIIEYVRDSMLITSSKLTDSKNTQISRKTYIRTSNDPKDKWVYHMLETAILVSEE